MELGAQLSIRRWKCLLNAYHPLWGCPPVHTIASDSVSIFPRCVPPHRQCTPIGRKTSGSDPALLRSAFYSTGWHISSFPSSPLVLFSNCCNELTSCQWREGGRTTAKGYSSLPCIGRSSVSFQQMLLVAKTEYAQPCSPAPRLHYL